MMIAQCVHITSCHLVRASGALRSQSAIKIHMGGSEHWVWTAACMLETLNGAVCGCSELWPRWKETVQGPLGMVQRELLVASFDGNYVQDNPLWRTFSVPANSNMSPFMWIIAHQSSNESCADFPLCCFRIPSYYAAAGGHLLEKTETMHSSYQFSKEGKRLIASSSIHSLNKK